MRLGIDFGTCRTVVAMCDRGNYPVVSFSDANGDACEYFPSVVAERAGALKFGFDALAVADDPEWTIVRSFKRWLATPVLASDTPVRVGSIEVGLCDLLAQFLAALRRALVSTSNVAKTLARQKGPLEIMVAAPAHALSGQRFVSLEAFERAGFDVLALLNEPSAAGFEYTHRYRSTLSSRRDQVVVYDLGGGTFDASLVRMTGARHEVVKTAGIDRLGGDDFDAILVDMVLREAGLARDAVDPWALRRLTDHCRELKEHLNTSSRKLTVDLAAHVPDTGLAELAISVSDYYAACAPLVDRTLDIVHGVMREALGQESSPAIANASVDGEAAVAALLEAGVAGVYVVGGASALPAISRALRDRYGRRVHRSPYPSAAAAIGLAICADDSAGLLLSDRFSRVLGVFRESDAGANVTFDSLFDRDAPLPGSGTRGARLERVYRAAHNVGHFRFVECSDIDDRGAPRGDLTHVGEIYFPFDAHLPTAAKELAKVHVERYAYEGPLVREAYEIDARGIVRLTIANLDDEYEVTYRIGDRASPTPAKRLHRAGKA